MHKRTIIRDLELAAGYAQVLTTKVDALLRDIEDNLPGYPSASDGPGSPGPGTSPVEMLALGHDQALHDADRIAVAFRRAHENMREAWGIYQRWVAPPPENKRGRQAGGGGCCIRTCEVYCSGVNTDRLRSGLCPKCWAAWMRAQSTEHDRHAWMQKRARWLEDQAVTDVTEDDAA